MARGLGSLEPSESLLQALGSRSEDNRGTHIFDLPLVLLSSVLARISDPVTAASVTCSCRLFRTISKSVPYRFRVSCTKLHEGAGALSEEGIQNKYSSTGVGMWTRKVLSTVRCQMPSTRVLDLSGCWIVDEDVAAVLADLRCLKCLILDGCQKLGHIGHGVEVWDFCEKRSVFSALTFLINAGALQDTDFFLEYRTSVKSAVADVSSRAGQEKRGSGMCTANELWGWFSEGIDAKSRFDGIDKNQGWAENCLLALRAAVNSSDLRRRTPLHTAALDGDTEMVRYLIFMGADSGLRDSAGGTALFSAAWFGYADICDLLLMSGADVLSRNRAGENPLYIAALRGHASAVEVMLSHCKANNINWQSAEVYGDGWTPLMAAAVADRQDVAKVLLQAACSDLCLDCTREECEICKKSWRGQDRESITALTFDNTEGVVLKSQECLKEGDTKDSRKKSTCTAEFSRNLSMKASPQILNAQNRYGQTALHIAARRASVWFVVNLLHVGASADIRDEYKKKPVDIANNQNHTLVADIFMQWDAQQRKGPPPGVLSHSSVISGNQVGPEQVRQGSVSSLSHWKSARKNDGIRSVQATSCAIMPLDNLKSGGSKRVWREKVKGSHQGTT